MKFDSYIVSETRTAFSVPLTQEIPIKKSFKQKAFTLAETLITLSIIGVIAAMTVPTLMTNINNQQHITALKKAYSNLSNAVKMMAINMGCDTDWSCVTAQIKDTYQFRDILASQLKTTQIMTNGIDFSDKYYSVYSPAGSFVTLDGTTMGFHGLMYHDTDENTSYELILIDTNGVDKGPNLFGKDRHEFIVILENDNPLYSGVVIPYGAKQMSNYDTWWKENYWQNTNFTLSRGNRAPLTGKVIETGKIDEADYK